MQSYEDWISGLAQKAQAVLDYAEEEAKRKAYKIFFESLKTDALKSYRKASLMFYGSYSPKYYRRSNGLLDCIDIAVGDDYIEGTIGGLTGRNGCDIFDIVFYEGYHGGAKHNGGYYYRKPYPYYKHWGSPAVQTTSVKDLFESYYDPLYEKRYEECIRNIDLFTDQIFDSKISEVI